LNAVDVAAATLSHFEKQDVATDACVLESTTEQEAIVKYVGRHLYRVRLKRLVKPKGIWTAVEIEVRSLLIPVRQVPSVIPGTRYRYPRPSAPKAFPLGLPLGVFLLPTKRRRKGKYEV
jgi:hypothetical protein